MESRNLDGSSQRLPISGLTKFLGSGKTTVLNQLIQQPALSRTLVLINELGEIGLDHDPVTHSKDDVIIEMSSGCLCCTNRHVAHIKAVCCAIDEPIHGDALDLYLEPLLLLRDVDLLRV